MRSTPAKSRPVVVKFLGASAGGEGRGAVMNWRVWLSR